MKEFFKYKSHFLDLFQWRKRAPLKIVITGSPRSGTSFLAGLIHQMGFNVGPKKWLKGANEYNPYGYFECVPLMKKSEDILEKLGGDFHDLPNFYIGWTNNLNQEKKEIINIIRQGNIEVYKGNRLMVLADLYDELFPNLKWIFINRDINDTYNSRFGEHLSFEEWEHITLKRLNVWHNSKPSQKSLNLDYQDFKIDLEGTIERIQNHLEISLTNVKKKQCIDFFKPRN